EIRVAGVVYDVVIARGELAEDVGSRGFGPLQCCYLSSVCRIECGQLVALVLGAGEVSGRVFDDQHAEHGVGGEDGPATGSTAVGDAVEATNTHIECWTAIFEIKDLPRDDRTGLIVNDDEMRSLLVETAADKLLHYRGHVKGSERGASSRIKLLQVRSHIGR